MTQTNLAAMSEQGFEFEVEIPEVREKTGWFITVRGDQSKKVLDFSRRKYNERQTRELQAKRRGKDPEQLSLDDAEDLLAESAAIRIIGWKGLTEGEGDQVKDVPFTPDGAVTIMKSLPWVRDQVLAEAAALANFIKK